MKKLINLENHPRIMQFQLEYPEYIMKMPALILGIPLTDKISYKNNIPYISVDSPIKFINKTKEWHYITHQTAGHMCNHLNMHVLFLKPLNKTVESNMRKLSDKYFYSDMTSPPMFDDASDYVRIMKNLFGVTVNNSYHELQEAYYPIDATFDNIKKITSWKSPKDFNDLIAWENDTQRVIGYFNRWNLAIISRNCD